MLLQQLDSYRQTIGLRMWAFAKVPMLYWVRPSIVELTDKRVEIAIPLCRRNRNHMKSMYFGVLVCGADVAGGLLALKTSYDLKQPVSLIFKDFSAQFFRRPDADTHFICEQGKEVSGLVKKAIRTGKREETTVEVIATCPETSAEEPVAKFGLTLSVKKAHKKPGGIIMDILGDLLPLPKA
ncbi:MAG: DUF4442 domain-containing protein [Oligoflexales bacterium]|nr:DUF4442 domain-containing protein [Oligoflexales bacterium]